MTRLNTELQLAQAFMEVIAVATVIAGPGIASLLSLNTTIQGVLRRVVMRANADRGGMAGELHHDSLGHSRSTSLWPGSVRSSAPDKACSVALRPDRAEAAERVNPDYDGRAHSSAEDSDVRARA